ncbi:sperm flagellar protein 1-like [Ambystoma mexicanum]|uniref:sperm flagellar protein 1-like n=1 Tax=Ambystoma mexicanum TaxID=8296 RepID=UPI0037E96F25
MSGSMAPADSLQGLCAWIDQVPLSRPKRSLSRDMSDGVMVAEIVKHFLPKLVEMHNYVPANSTQQKLSNWSTLNRKVFSKLNFQVSVEDVRKLVANSPDVVEPILSSLRQKIEEKLQEKASRDRPGKPAKDLEYFSTGITQDHSNLNVPSYGKTLREQNPMQWGYSSPGRANQSLYAQLDPQVRLLLEEKEQAVMTLQETVQILQMKIHRLEHLVQLKDLRIEDLTRHLTNPKLRNTAK